MKIAYFTPLSPVKSGISHYSEDLLPYLLKYLDVDVFIDDYEPAKELREKFNIYYYFEFEKKYGQGEYDIILYHMGNNPYHFYLYPFLIKYPGITVLHDYVLHHFFAGLTLVKGDIKGYIEEFKYNSGKTGEELASLRLRGIWTDIQQFIYPLNKRIIDSSLGVIAHSDYIKREIEEDYKVTNIKKINMGIPVIDTIPFSKKRLKEKMGLPYDAFVVSIFGFVTPIKQVDLSIKAFHFLIEEVPKSILLIVGDIQDSKIYEIIKELHLEGSVKITGYVPEEDFKEYIQATDVAINLRYPTAGETSASLLNIMGMGVPVIISNYRQFAEIPDDCCIKIDLGEKELNNLCKAIGKLADSRWLRKSIGEKGREYVAKNCSLEGAAKAYYEFIAEVVYQKKVAFNIVKNISAELADIGITADTPHALGDFKRAIKELSLK